MNTFIKYLVMAVAFYCSINWLADNPNIIVDFRDKMNEIIGVGTEKAKEVVKENTE